MPAREGPLPATLTNAEGTDAASVSNAPRSFVIWQNTQSGERGAWSLIGAAYQNDYVPLHTATIPVEWDIAASADLNGDGAEDLIWQNQRTGERGVWLMNGLKFSGQYVLLHSQTISPEWQITAAADMNGDGKPDLIWQNERTGERGVWLLNGTAYAGWLPLYGSYIPVDWDIAAVGDMTGDGHPDVVWQNRMTGERGVWRLNGTTYLGWAPLYSSTIPTAWDIAALRDQDGDGSPDILWQNTQTGERGTWLMNGTTWTGTWMPLYPHNVPPQWRIATMMSSVATGTGLHSLDFQVYTQEMNVGATVQPRAIARDAAGNVLAGVPLSFASRDASIATVSATGVVTSHGAGQTILVVASAADAQIADSLLLVVVPSGGVTVGTSMGLFEVGPDSLVSVVVAIDGSRASAVPGSGILEVTWNPAAMTLAGTSARPGYQVASSETVPGRLRISFAAGSQAPAPQVVELSFRTGKTTGVQSNLTPAVLELNSAMLADLLPVAVSIVNPIRIR